MRKTGLLSNLFKNIKTVLIGYSGQSSVNAPFSKELYQQETVRAVIDCIATHAAKAEAMHVVMDNKGRIKEIKRDSPFAYLLNMRPNDIMSGYDLKYKLITQLEDKTTALCYIKWQGAIPAGILPINYNHFEFYRIEGGGYAVQFSDYDGAEYTLPLEDVVVLRKFYNNFDVSGEGNGPIYNTLDMVKAADDGLNEALNVSNKVRGIIKQKKSMLSPADVQANTEEFIRRFEQAAKNGGIVGIDSMEDFVPLNITPWSAGADQMKDIRLNILRYWRISEAILQSDYNESQWQAFYEGVIEPILIAMGQAFTNACFTRKEQMAGNRIIFNSSVLINMSMQTKTQLLNSTREIGLFTRNEQREMFGYPPIVGGDDALISLNYIKGSDQSAYQIGNKEEKENGNE